CITSVQPNRGPGYPIAFSQWQTFPLRSRELLARPSLFRGILSLFAARSLLLKVVLCMTANCGARLQLRGQKRTPARIYATSALPPKPDIAGRRHHIRKVPEDRVIGRRSCG